ncbi:MAG: MgtC/SapB family protein, partial [Firmicutes bacterium]|nr:MgtC/SapB family protein [Bacillota bacterium]
MAISNGEIIFRLLLASVVGLLFGIDRERANKPAGVRTFLIVCLASCVLAIVSAYGFPSVAGEYQGINLVSDPARLMVGVLTGIGFIGAGIIWRSPRGD